MSQENAVTESQSTVRKGRDREEEKRRSAKRILFNLFLCFASEIGLYELSLRPCYEFCKDLLLVSLGFFLCEPDGSVVRSTCCSCRVQFLSQQPGTPVPGELVPSSVPLGFQHTCVHTHRDTHTRHINKYYWLDISESRRESLST